MYVVDDTGVINIPYIRGVFFRVSQNMRKWVKSVTVFVRVIYFLAI